MVHFLKENSKGSVQTVEGNNAKLYDLVDLASIFNVSTRNLFNWRAKGVIKLLNIGGKLYMTPKMLNNLIESKGGIV